MKISSLAQISGLCSSLSQKQNSFGYFSHNWKAQMLFLSALENTVHWLFHPTAETDLISVTFLIEDISILGLWQCYIVSMQCSSLYVVWNGDEKCYCLWLWMVLGSSHCEKMCQCDKTVKPHKNDAKLYNNSKVPLHWKMGSGWIWK